MELKSRKPVEGKWRLFTKWTKSTWTWHGNWGDPTNLALNWLEQQGCMPGGIRFCRNAGRRSLAAWLDSSHTPYHEGFQLHGDLYKVWRRAYQPSVANSEYNERDQSTDPRIATAALRRFQQMLGRGMKADQCFVLGSELLHICGVFNRRSHMQLRLNE